jgi:pyruvate dehydrogenase E2 component (dihydrolipoamide acetyltransferase)
MGEGTFTISNLGMFEIDSFTAVINPPEVAILALGKIKELPVIIDGMFVARPLMIATLSVDHRVVDGIIAARFLTTFKELLENPFRLTIDPPQDTNQ